MQKNKEAIVWGITPPGAFLEEKIQEMGIDVNDFAARIGYTPKTVNEILRASAASQSKSRIPWITPQESQSVSGLTPKKGTKKNL